MNQVRNIYEVDGMFLFDDENHAFGYLMASVAKNPPPQWRDMDIDDIKKELDPRIKERPLFRLEELQKDSNLKDFRDTLFFLFDELNNFINSATKKGK